MKQWMQIVVLLVAATGLQAAEGKYREFTNTEGQTMTGAVVAYDAKTQTVTIERENRRTAKVPISVFVEEDQTYILEWEASKGFLSNSLLKINCSRQRTGDRKEQEFKTFVYDGSPEELLMKEVLYESTFFEVELYNKNAYDMKDLRMEYIVYYEQSKESWEKPVTKQLTRTGEVKIPLLTSRKTTTVETEPVEVYTDKINSHSWTSGKSRTGGEGKVHGFRARLYLKMSSGAEVMREFSLPEKLSYRDYRWKE